MVARIEGYEVDPDEVDRVVATMFSQIDELGRLSRELGQLVPPASAYGLIGRPAAAASQQALSTLVRAQQALERTFNYFTQNIQTAMRYYRAADQSGMTRFGGVGSEVATLDSWVQALRSRGLDANQIHTYLQDHRHQVGAGVAEVYVGGQLSQVRLRPGDLVTTNGVTATVGDDGRLYADGQPVQLPGGEARVYRTMMTSGGAG
jgi:hypothetical protein